MANRKHISLSQDELFGAIKASQFMLAELASYMKAEPYMRDRILSMQKALREIGLVSGEGDAQKVVATEEEYPLFFKGMQEGLNTVLAIIESRIPNENQLELFHLGEQQESKIDSSTYHTAVDA